MWEPLPTSIAGSKQRRQGDFPGRLGEDLGARVNEEAVNPFGGPDCSWGLSRGRDKNGLERLEHTEYTYEILKG